MKSSLYIICLCLTVLSFACSGNNCPLNNVVTCNYHFYDSEGNSIKLNDYLTVKTLLPGYKKQYTYKKLGEKTIVSDTPIPEYTESGYIESVSDVRKDTVLVNKANNRSNFSVPMSFTNTADTLVFQYESISYCDTIIIEHTSHPFVEMPECGSYMFHTLKNVKFTEAGIYKVELANRNVDFEGNENVKVYFNSSSD